MSIDTPPIPPGEGSKKKNNNLLWGCLIALVLALVVLCCGTTLVVMPLVTDTDPLGLGIRERIEQIIPLEYLEDPSSIPGFEEYLDDENLSEIDEVDSGQVPQSPKSAWDLPLSVFYFTDINTSFFYPAGWEVEVEGYSASFYEPDSYSYLYVAEYPVDPGTRAEDVTAEFLESIQEDAQEGSYQLLDSGEYYVPIPGEAYQALFEWVDSDGYYTWAYDLEIVSGESNLMVFMSGEDPEEIDYYRDLLDIIADSLELMPEIESGEDI